MYTLAAGINAAIDCFIWLTNTHLSPLLPLCRGGPETSVQTLAHFYLPFSCSLPPGNSDLNILALEPHLLPAM